MYVGLRQRLKKYVIQTNNLKSSDLHDVVFWNRADNPRVVRVPREVRNLGGVTSVDEQKLWRSVFGVLSSLLFANLGQVPNVETTVSSGRGQDGLVMGGPLDLRNGNRGISTDVFNEKFFFHTLTENFLLQLTWKISSLCDSKEWSLSFKFRRSQSATVLSAEPEAKMNSE